jgi:hypothetical protein
LQLKWDRFRSSDVDCGGHSGWFSWPRRAGIGSTTQLNLRRWATSGLCFLHVVPPDNNGEECKEMDANEKKTRERRIFDMVYGDRPFEEVLNAERPDFLVRRSVGGRYFG